KAVFASWFGKRANDYRNSQKIPHDLGTAVNVVTMVFGNMGDDSGTGVAFTRNPNTGEDQLFGEYLTNAQGEDVVAGIRTPLPISQLQQDMPAVYDEFNRIGRQLERHYRNVQDLEFTIERGRLYMLQTRDAKRTAAAAVKIATDMVDEGVISSDDCRGMAVAEGAITARGGATSHAAVVARQIGKPCVAGSSALDVNYGAKSASCSLTGIDFKEGDWLSLDGTTGDLYLGEL